jgi:hypothetical protein
MKSQGMKDNQQVVCPTAARPFHPCSEHVIDWFHITMRLTVLQQQTKTLQGRQEVGEEVAKQLECAKHLLWPHGNAEEALERLVSVVMHK